MVEQESIYKKYNINLNGKDTFVYACKNLTTAEATKDIKSRFKPYKVTKVKPVCQVQNIYYIEV